MCIYIYVIISLTDPASTITILAFVAQAFEFDAAHAAHARPSADVPPAHLLDLKQGGYGRVPPLTVDEKLADAAVACGRCHLIERKESRLKQVELKALARKEELIHAERQQGER